MQLSTTLPTALGVFTLTADEAGLCGLSFPEEHQLVLHKSLVAIATHPLLHEAGRQLLAYISGSLRDFDLPLSIQGTAFQLQVWEQLRTIAYGQTMTYGELAERIGGRHKARAVGGAAHANPLAIIIPCHRLIGAGGKLTGFGGGLPMKQALLNLEGSSCKD
ncbi:methylated-DNA--[protein]-cysteine S-methyltransferase [uncultured Desulfobulbus sp.]|uniref:methylated-DNA--[protein]-cysteine S-methyltransferase n=1 Tax=uncultured Desulfobulbus sp. TaxID=239745 RepID=UPI0029C9A965|nr:methylated-DNA--[protein]-cysteine S-methyltransferase [uncultured Desulfobulbus sp.]